MGITIRPLRIVGPSSEAIPSLFASFIERLMVVRKSFLRLLSFLRMARSSGLASSRKSPYSVTLSLILRSNSFVGISPSETLVSRGSWSARALKNFFTFREMEQTFKISTKAGSGIILPSALEALRYSRTSGNSPSGKGSGEMMTSSISLVCSVSSCTRFGFEEGERDSINSSERTDCVNSSVAFRI